MLEAVNSVLQSAPLVRGHSEQVASSDSFAANPERTQRAAPQAPFVSPYIFMDVNFDKAVLQLRNGDTGDVVDQFPSEASLNAAARQSAQREIARHQAAQQQAPAAPQQDASAPSPRQGQSAAPSAAPPAPKAESFTPQQRAAFQAAVQAGNTNAGHNVVASHVEVFA